ncbi:hypothetical protein EZV62_002902 [Acer yangbiense]|uniref:Uncharacterized protein n=1 Tax=Acer yangbiense TaxID=1000413 RepID=A0A5C7IYN0_9ROSI|nr:hypothetical protein EZV62_002902 [Acer yangbiense]
MEECLVGALRIGVLCSMESPADRMEMTDVVAKLCAIRENFLSRRTGDVWPRLVLKPRQPFTHTADDAKGRLQISVVTFQIWFNISFLGCY